MANSYTSKLKKRMPSPGDFDWDDEWHDNEKIDDVIAGGLLSRNRLLFGGVVSDGGDLIVAYTAMVVVVAGVRYEIAAGTLALDASALSYIYVDNTGALIDSTTPPSGDYIPVALVDTDVAGIVHIGDARPMATEVLPGQNIFINGGMGIDQENAGAAVSVSTAAKYFLDMCECTAANHSAVVDAQQVAGFGGFTKAGKLTVTTADTLASNEYGHGFRKFIEYKDCQLIAGRYLAVKFKFKAKITGTYSAALVSGNASNSYVTTFSYGSAEAVQDVSLLIPVPSAKVVEGSNSRGLALYVGVAAVGTKATATLNAWQAGEYFSASTATDWEVTIGNYISWTGVYGGVDVIPAEFPFRQHAESLALCQRYLQVFGNPGVNHISAGGAVTGTTAAYIAFPLMAQLRGTPVVTASNIGGCAIRHGSSSVNPSAVAFALLDGHHADLAFTITGGTTNAPASLNINGTITIDARM